MVRMRNEGGREDMDDPVSVLASNEMEQSSGTQMCRGDPMQRHTAIAAESGRGGAETRQRKRAAPT